MTWLGPVGPANTTHSCPPYLRFHIPGFELPIANCSPKIFNGKFHRPALWCRGLNEATSSNANITYYRPSLNSGLLCFQSKSLLVCSGKQLKYLVFCHPYARSDGVSSFAHCRYVGSRSQDSRAFSVSLHLCHYAF